MSCPHTKSRIVASPLYPLVKPKFYEQTTGNDELHDLLSDVNKKCFFVSIILTSFTSHESYFNTANFIFFYVFSVSKFFGYFTLSDLLH